MSAGWKYLTSGNNDLLRSLYSWLEDIPLELMSAGWKSLTSGNNDLLRTLYCWQEEIPLELTSAGWVEVLDLRKNDLLTTLVEGEYYSAGAYVSRVEVQYLTSGKHDLLRSLYSWLEDIPLELTSAEWKSLTSGNNDLLRTLYQWPEDIPLELTSAGWVEVLDLR
jgi:hypothetical protein